MVSNLLILSIAAMMVLCIGAAALCINSSEHADGAAMIPADGAGPYASEEESAEDEDQDDGNGSTSTVTISDDPTGIVVGSFAIILCIIMFVLFLWREVS